MRLLITGGAGCLGLNLVERYLPRGHDILVIDNFATGRRDALPEATGLTLVEANVADRPAVDRIFADFRPTHVIHSAAAYRDPDDWREDAATNVLGTVNVVEAARRGRAARFVNFQTALCYGRPDRLPITVDHSLRPIASYGVSKTAGEAYVALSPLSWVSLRIANVTGPHLAIGPIPTFYQRIKSGQKCQCTGAVRDFLDIEDFLALIDLVLPENAPGGFFNASTGIGHSIKEVYEEVAAALGVGVDEPVAMVPLGRDDIAAVVLDPTRTCAAFGWRAKTGFAVSIARMVEWYDRHGVGTVHSHLRAVSGQRR